MSLPIFFDYYSGIPVTMNTDGPALFGISLTSEMHQAARVFDFSYANLRCPARYALKASFTPPHIKKKLSKAIIREGSTRVLCKELLPTVHINY